MDKNCYDSDLYSIDEIIINPKSLYIGSIENDCEIAVISGNGILSSYAFGKQLISGMFRHLYRGIEWKIYNNENEPFVFLLITIKAKLKGESNGDEPEDSF